MNIEKIKEYIDDRIESIRDDLNQMSRAGEKNTRAYSHELGAYTELADLKEFIKENIQIYFKEGLR
jgi:hypothetical protein